MITPSQVAKGFEAMCEGREHLREQREHFYDIVEEALRQAILDSKNPVLIDHIDRVTELLLERAAEHVQFHSLDMERFLAREIENDFIGTLHFKGIITEQELNQARRYE